MPSPAFARIAPVSYAANAADQIAIAAVPLALTAAGAAPATISTVVAAQAAAWLLVALPAGALADRVPRRTLMLWGAAAAVLGAGLAAAATSGALPSGGVADGGLAFGAFLLSAGVVMQILSIFALMPGIVEPAGLGRANARLEFVRALFTIGAPVTAAYLIARGHSAVPFVAAAVAGLIGFAAVLRLDRDPPATTARQPMLAAIRDGGTFVVREPILRAIALCALGWNPAFVCLLSMFAPFATGALGLSLEQAGWAWAVYGIGALTAALVAPLALARVRTGILFAAGPIGSVVGSLIIAAGGPRFGLPAVMLGFFLVGFTPMIWLVLQTSVRQLLTPPDYLGRVAATMTAAIYGVRPLGALAAGLAATWGTPTAAMWVSVGLFSLSSLAILVSPAIWLKELPRRL